LPEQSNISHSVGNFNLIGFTIYLLEMIPSSPYEEFPHPCII